MPKPQEPTVKTSHIVMPRDHMDELYHSQNPMVRFVHNRRLDIIAGLLDKSGGQKVLDAGCGEGHLLEKMHARAAANQYYGADIIDVALEQAKKRCPFAEFSRANLGELPYGDGFFDTVVCTEVIEHIYEYRVVLAEFSRVLKPGGTLIISFPNEPLWTLARFLLGRRPIKVPDHVNSFSPQSMRPIIPMRPAGQWSVPFPLPFFLSLGAIMRFKK